MHLHCFKYFYFKYLKLSWRRIYFFIFEFSLIFKSCKNKCKSLILLKLIRKLVYFFFSKNVKIERLSQLKHQKLKLYIYKNCIIFSNIKCLIFFQIFCFVVLLKYFLFISNKYFYFYKYLKFYPKYICLLFSVIIFNCNNIKTKNHIRMDVVYVITNYI